MSSERRKFILVKAEPGTGLSNNRMGLDIAVGLAHLTGRTLVLYDERPIFAGLKPRIRNGRKGANLRLPRILDYYDMPIPLVSEAQFRNESWKLNCRTLPWRPAVGSMFYSSDLDPSGSVFHSFRSGRRFAYTISEWEQEFDVLRIDVRMLSMYSHFFLLPDQQRPQLIDIMRGITPQQAYAQFADALIQELGMFNAIHLRRGDFWRITPNPRKVDAIEILANIQTCFSRDDLLVISTDDSTDVDFFSPILKHFPNAMFLDQYLLESQDWSKRLRELPVYDDTVLALISQLTVSRASCFVGSLFSTFSAIIHRNIGFERPDEPFRYACYPVGSGKPEFRDCVFQPTQEGNFSWNRLPYPLPTGTYSWFREWPEAFS